MGTACCAQRADAVTSLPLDDAPSVAAWLGQRLEEEAIAYAIGGALALAAHGVPRMTNDVDLSVFVPEKEIETLFDALERAGCLFDRHRAQAEVSRFALFTVRCGRIGVDLFVAFHSHHHEAFLRRLRLPGPDGKERWFLSAEDLAILKLALFRAKDQMDLENLFAVQGARLDVPYIQRWLWAIVPEGDPRRTALCELERRFLRTP